MNGVEILATEEVVVAYAWNWSAYVLTVGIVAIIAGLGCLFGGNLLFEDFLFGVIVGAIFGALLGILPAKSTMPSEYETQ